MEPLDLTRGFIEKCDRSDSTDRLAVAFQRTIEVLGFRHFACCSHVDPLRPPRRAVVLHSYPIEWVQHFSNKQFYDIDPVFLHAEKTLLPFFWNAPEFRSGLLPPQVAILSEAESFGIAHGYTIPIHSATPLGRVAASCSVVPESRSIDHRSYSAVRVMCSHLYAAACRNDNADNPSPAQSALSPRERQCLELVALGKTDWVIGRILNLTETTVHNHIESAKRRLGVATRVQAVMLALASQQLSIGDVMNPQKPDVD